MTNPLPAPAPAATQDPIFRGLLALAAYAASVAEGLDQPAKPASRLAAFFPIAFILNRISNHRRRRARYWARALAALTTAPLPQQPADDTDYEEEEDGEIDPPVALPLAPRLVFQLAAPLAPATATPTAAQPPTHPRTTPIRHTPPRQNLRPHPASRRLLPPPRAAPFNPAA